MQDMKIIFDALRHSGEALREQEQENNECQRLQGIEERLRAAIKKAKREVYVAVPEFYDVSLSEKEMAEWKFRDLEEILGKD